eukprot:3708055-Lingulodinium_polyedra.AAC.1
MGPPATVCAGRRRAQGASRFRRRFAVAPVVALHLRCVCFGQRPGAVAAVQFAKAAREEVGEECPPRRGP